MNQTAEVRRESTLLVWNAEGAPPAGDWITVLWSGFGTANDPSVISIPKLVEEQADVLRARYLAWIYELGETHINGKRLVDHLELRPDLSYWWMTSQAQKFNSSGTSQVDNAIKAFVLESLVAEYKPTSIKLVTSNDKIALMLQRFCQKLKIRYMLNPVRPTKKSKPLTKQIYRILPYPLQALVFFIWYLLKGVPLLRNKQVAASPFKGGIAFVDALVHLDKNAFTSGKFISNYWTSLVDRLDKSGVKINWFHNYFCQEQIPTLVRAQNLIGCFNRFSSEAQAHALIEENLSLPVFIHALKDYFRTIGTSFHLSTIRRHFQPSDSSLDLWPLFRQEWIDSLVGPGAMFSCLRISLFEKTFSDIPYQKTGVYIQENQPWEMALIYAWKAAGHGKLIGVPHTTVRYWDMRYFYDSRSYRRTGKNDLPIPDLVAVNGPVAKKLYLEGGYPEHQVTEVEALRFIYLLNRLPADTQIKPLSKALNILVCGDFLSTTNYKILSWLAYAAQSLPPETSYVFKPHPACSVDPSEFRSLALEVVNAPLTELFADCDVVFTSNLTSAAVDAYCSGFPVVQMLDGNAFNMSPLRGLGGVVYVTNPKELAEAFLHCQRRERVMIEPYFYLDGELPRWRKLLSLSTVCQVGSCTMN